MSAESPVIRNFKGLDKYESLLSELRLVVNKGYGDVFELQSDEALAVSLPDFRDLGLTLKFSGGVDDIESGLQSASAASGISSEDVDFVVVAESGFLRNREILFRISVSALTTKHEIIPWKAVRSDTLSDRRHGFDLNSFFVLNKEIPVKPLRPHRLGTVLARSSFGIKTNRIGSGLLPLPLTEEVRAQNGLPRNTLLFVDQFGELFDSEGLDEAINVYIDEEIHSDLGRLRTKEAKLFQSSFAIQALGQLVYLASAELASLEINEDLANSPVGRFLHSQVTKVTGKKSSDGKSTLELIRSKPSVVAAQLTAQYKLREQTRNFFVVEDED